MIARDHQCRWHWQHPVRRGGAVHSSSRLMDAGCCLGGSARDEQRVPVPAKLTPLGVHHRGATNARRDALGAGTRSSSRWDTRVLQPHPPRQARWNNMSPVQVITALASLAVLSLVPGGVSTGAAGEDARATGDRPTINDPTGALTMNVSMHPRPHERCQSGTERQDRHRHRLDQRHRARHRARLRRGRHARDAQRLRRQGRDREDTRAELEETLRRQGRLLGRRHDQARRDRRHGGGGARQRSARSTCSSTTPASSTSRRSRRFPSPSGTPSSPSTCPPPSTPCAPWCPR